jgi:hypothetical protein
MLFDPVARHDGGKGDPPPPPPVPPGDSQNYDKVDDDDDYEQKEKRGDKRRKAPRGPPADPSDSSSSDGSARRNGRRRKRSSTPSGRKKSPKSYRVRSEKMNISAWPTAQSYPEWRRNLRSEIAAATDHPAEAVKWIFNVEKDGCSYAEMASDRKDPLRGLDAKLQNALGKITKGEAGRKLAILMEKVAVDGVLISGRQHLLFIYDEFKKDGHMTDAIAYSNFERLTFKGDENLLEGFLTLWDQLLMSFRTPPADDHLFSTFYARVKNVPGLRICIEYLDRVDYTNVDKNYSYLMHAARTLVDRRRTDRQTLEFNKIFTGGANHALAAGDAGDGKGKKGGGKGDKKEMPCFALRDKGSCPDGKSCAYSHDPAKIKLAKAAQEAKGKGKGKKGGGKGKGEVKMTADGKRICGYFLSGSCKKGADCNWAHQNPSPSTPAPTVTPSTPSPSTGGSPAQPAGQGRI